MCEQNVFMEMLKEVVTIQHRLSDFDLKWRMSKENHELFRKEISNMDTFVKNAMSMAMEQDYLIDIEQSYITDIQLHINKLNKLISLVDQSAEEHNFDVIEEYMIYIADCISKNSKYTEPILSVLLQNNSNQ